MAFTSRGKRRPKDQKPAPTSAGDSGIRGPGRGAHINAAVTSEMGSALEDSLGYKRLTGQGLTADELADRRAADVTAMLNRLTDKQINRAIVQAGGKERKDRTIRRWKRFGTLPKDITTAPVDAKGKPGLSAEELISRHATIVELGGPVAAARKLGRHVDSVRRWQAGRTNEFSKEAKKVMRKEQVVADGVRHAKAPPPRIKPGQRRRRKPAAKTYGTPARGKSGSGGGGKPTAPKVPMPRPKIKITGKIDYEGDGVEYERASDTLDLSTVGWPEADVKALIIAVHDQDYETVIKLCERAATERWANRSSGGAYEHAYSDTDGFRIKRVDDVELYFD